MRRWKKAVVGNRKKSVNTLPITKLTPIETDGAGHGRYCGPDHNASDDNVQNGVLTTRHDVDSLMQNNTADVFDFDDWAGLYLENPAEFEARRQATLMLEMLRCSPDGTEACRQMLDSFELAVEGRRTEERMSIAANLMMDSLHQLSAELQILQLTLQQLEQQEKPVQKGSVAG